MTGIYYYGFPENSLTMAQLIKVIRFQQFVEPWLTEHLSKFGEKWTVVIDKEANSFRLVFDNIEDEVWFKLAWMHGAKLDFETIGDKN